MFENHQIDRLPDETQRTIKMCVYLPDKDDEAYGVAVDLAGDQMTGSSKRQVLFALQQLRRRHDERRILVDCYGASENVYPSGMIESMARW